MKAVDIRDWYKLLDKGWGKEVEKAIDGLDGDDRLEGELWKTLWLGYYHGKLQKAEMDARMVLTRDQLSKRIEIVARLVIADLLKAKIFDDDYGQLLKQIQSLLDKLTPSQQEEFRHYEVWFSYLFSRYTANYLKDSSTAIQLLSNTIPTTREKGFPIKYFESLLLNTRAAIESGIGEYYKSINDYIECIEIYSRLKNNSMIIWPMMGLSSVYRILGELDEALLISVEASKIAEKLGYVNALSLSFRTIGMLFNVKGEFSKAKSSYEKALKFVQEKNLIYLFTYSSFIKNLLDMKEFIQAEKHLAEFYKLCEELDTPLEAEWMKALYLKKIGEDFESKAQAQKLFRELLSKVDTDFHWKFLVLFHLIDLLLEEAKTFNNVSKIQEVNILLNQASEMSQDSPRALIQANLLQARILLIEGEVDQSLSLLDETYSLALTKKLYPLAEQAKKQQGQLQNELTRWKGIIESNATVAERLELADVRNYLHTAIKLRELSEPSVHDSQKERLVS